MRVVLVVWVLQLVPGGLLLLVGAARAAQGHLGAWTLAALAAGALWTTATLLVVLLPAGRRWLAARRLECLTVVTSVLACLVAGDVALTLTGVVPTVAAQRARSLDYTVDHFTGYRLVPGRVTVDGAAAVHINRRGFRGPEIESPKPAGRTRIVFLGGSQVFDFHGAEGGWPEGVGARLRARGYDVDVINAAVPGYGTADALSTLLSDLWVLEPDVVLVCNGWNDTKYFPRLGPGEPLRGLPPPEAVSWQRDWRLHPSGLDRLLSASAFYRAVRWSVAGALYAEEGVGPGTWGRPLGEAAAARAFGQHGPRQYRLNLRLLARAAEEVGATLVLCRQARRVGLPGPADPATVRYAERNTGLGMPALERAFDAVDAVVAELVRAGDARLVDMHAALSAEPGHFRDAIHFSPAGSRAAAELVADVLEAMLAKPGD